MANNQIQNVISRNRNVPPNPPTPIQDCRPRSEAAVVEPIVVFFVGGAGDKESYYGQGPYRNVSEVRDYFDPKVRDLATSQQYKSIYLGYTELRGENNIKSKIFGAIPSKAARVYIVGHSLGGWNGAHLSTILSNEGYNVEVLITLDPVGEGKLVWLGSNIHMKKPIPKSKYWINILAKPTEGDGSDVIADFGERWSVTSGPNLNYIADVNHYDAKKMFVAPLKNGKSAADILYDSIRGVMVP